MKKLTLFIVLILSFKALSQISPAEFPKIGYADMYWLHKFKTGVNYTDSSFYYPRLNELGLTHVVSYADNNSLNPVINNTIKILDNGFPRSFYTGYNWQFKYSMGTGNYTDRIPYEAGGNSISLITDATPAHNFGFGGSNTSSWWIYGYNGQCIGDKNKEDLPNFPGTKVHFAQVGVHSQGIMLIAKPDATHLPYNVKWGHEFMYKLRIRARIDGAAGSVNVARVRIWEQIPGSPLPPISSNKPIYENIFKNQGYQNPQTPVTLTDYAYYITADDFGGTQYIDLVSPDTFRKTLGIDADPPSDLYISIEWLGTRNLYVDKLSIYNTFYEDLFVANSTVQTTTRNGIKSDLEYLFGSVKTNQLFAHPYNDEPMPAMYRAVGEVSNLSEQQLGTGKYVTGATGPLPNDMIFHANSERRMPYMLYDSYTIYHGTDTASAGANSIQNAYSNLINTVFGDAGYGALRYSGLKQAIQWAQNFTPDNTSDDVPMYSTLQVQAEKRVNGSQITQNRFRAPSYYEILAEGNLSLCYGAKGIMYFTIFTDTYTNNNVSYYGLFDEQNNPYNDRVNPLTGLSQSAANPQVTNIRFQAVKKLNQHIDKVKSELLQLTWRNAFSIHQGQPTGTYINNVSTVNHKLILLLN